MIWACLLWSCLICWFLNISPSGQVRSPLLQGLQCRAHLFRPEPRTPRERPVLHLVFHTRRILFPLLRIPLKTIGLWDVLRPWSFGTTWTVTVFFRALEQTGGDLCLLGRVYCSERAGIHIMHHRAQMLTCCAFCAQP